MKKCYSRINFENKPSTATPLNATNLNKMDAAINTIDARVVENNTRTLTNLLRPTLATSTTNGVTITNNGGDGTYTLNGTATAGIGTLTFENIQLNAGTYKLAGCPSGGTSSTYRLVAFNKTTNTVIATDLGNGDTLTLAERTTVRIYPVVENGTVCSNLVFKPMLTTDLDATYDDFVPFTGGTGTLNGDVADIREDVDIRTTELKMLGWTVPDDCPIQNTVNGNTFTQKVGRVDLGSLTWTRGTSWTNPLLYADVGTAKKYGNTNLSTSIYSTVDIDYNSMGNLTIRGNGSSTRVYIRNDSYTDATTFKSAMSGVYLYYELASSVTWQIDGNELTNLKTVGDAWNSSTTYTVGQYCIYGNKLWKCLTQNSGVTPTEGSYWTKTDVASEIPIVETQKVTVSGFDGSDKETTITFTDAYPSRKKIVLGVYPQTFDTSHYVKFIGKSSPSSNQFYIEHNLSSSVSYIMVTILYC